MNKYFTKIIEKSKQKVAITLSIMVVLFACGFIPSTLSKNEKRIIPTPKEAEANYHFDPSGGALITGTTAPILGATAAAVEGVNVGDWRGTEADDNLHWGFASTASGYNAYLDIGGVKLNGANKIFIQTEFDLDATIPQTYVQICDWVSSTGVNNAADSECVGGGWRTLNTGNVIINTATPYPYDFEIYDGYWNDTALQKIDTPLSNFIDNTGKVRVRYYSTISSTGSLVNIDYLRLFAVVNPTYSASGATVISGGTPLGDYSLTSIGGTRGGTPSFQDGSDDLRFRVPGTAGVLSDFYLSFSNVKTYAGANTILYRAEYSCSATGISIKPKIFNFSTYAWEDMTTGTIACSATDATNAWAKNNIAITDYLNNGEMRIGWYGSANAVTEIRLDTSYMMIGTVNNGTAQITYGSNSSGSSNDTRDLDMTGTSNTWRILSADESNTQAFATYGNDTDNDVNVEEASAANMDFTLIPPANAVVSGVYFSSRHMSGAAGTVMVGIADDGGITAATGGWTAVGAGGATALTYTDNISVNSALSGGAAGMNTNPGNHIDSETGRMNMRLRTSAAGATTNNSIAQWDFAMISLQWTEDVEHRSRKFRYDPSDGVIVMGTNPPILGATAAATEGVNMGDRRGTEADDNLHFGIQSTTSGFNAYLDIEKVSLHGANAMIIQTEFDLDATVPTTFVQICDWTSSTGVSAVADAQCTGGGWRNLNIRDVGITTTTATAYSWQVYDGYWNNTATGKISTPLTNFIDGSGTVRIRYFSTTNTTSIINIDYLRMFAVINPVYFASGATQISGGAIAGDYSLATTAGAGQSGSDNQYFTVAGTASAISNFYMSYTGVKTYSGANTILYRAEYSCSTTGISIKPKIYNFNTTLWEDLTTATIACSATDATNAWAKSGVNINDYISGGEIRIGWYGSANNVLTIRLDLAYVMIGTVNNGTSEISFGSNSAGSAANTTTLDMTAAASTWNILSADESNTQGFPSYAFDGDNDATVEEARAANMDFTLTPPVDTRVTGVFFASRFMAGTAGTVNIGIADAGGLTSVQGGWSQVGANGTTALVYTDNITMASAVSGGAAGWFTNPDKYVNTDNGRMNMRLRTSSSGATTNNSVAQWDFAMMSLQWIETPLPPATLTFSISDSSIGFGALSAAGASYATGDGLGSGTPTVAHTMSASSNSPGGYVIALNGNTLSYGDKTIAPIGSNAMPSTPGTEQFGLRLTSSGGYGVAIPPYGTASYFGFGTSDPNVVAVNNSSDNVSTDFSVYYVANISGGTAAGEYSSVLSYVVTATF